MGKTTYRDALRKALSDGMTADPDIVLIGEEVGRYGGAYGVTKGLIDEFGAERVIDTPISEPSIVGAAVGAAMSGLRPVAELERRRLVAPRQRVGELLPRALPPPPACGLAVAADACERLAARKQQLLVRCVPLEGVAISARRLQ